MAGCQPEENSHPTLSCQIERQNGRTVVFRDKENFLQKRARFIRGYVIGDCYFHVVVFSDMDSSDCSVYQFTSVIYYAL